jgi:hypothetical protein
LWLAAAASSPEADTTLTIAGVTELRLSVPETGRRLLPLPVAVWHKTVGKANEAI